VTAIAAATTALAAAAADRRPCRPVRDLLPAGDIDTAYAVQSAVIGARTAAGARVVGRKIGLTNPMVQAQLGVDQPDFGVLLDDMACPQEVPVDYSRLLQPRIEAEIAFVLRHDLDQSGDITVDTVRAAVDYAVAALEIVDSRIAGWDIGIVDTVADNASAGLFVLGDTHRPLDDFDPVAVTMTMTRADEIVSTGSGVDCLGDPLAAVAWLATTARDYGAPLQAGDVVLSGALGPMVPVAPGDSFHAELTGLGSVHASFTSQTQEAP
jgi:2-keto-4-pentenoate hydratase